MDTFGHIKDGPSGFNLVPHAKAIVLVASLLIGLGMGWSEYKTALSMKADRTELDALARIVSEEHKRIEAERHINRILLCRLPEIKPDSHCQGLDK